MCGRFSLRLNHDEIQQLNGYDVDIEEWENEDAFVPRYNIAPRTQVPVIRHPNSVADFGRNPESIIMQTMKWGLVPHWSKFEDKSLNTTNARSENLVDGGGMWASIKGKNRCAIPCQGYYEWLAKGKDKLPHFTKRKDGKLLLLAGLYDSVVLDGKPLWTCTIVTTDANKEFSWLHDRQPVFLSNKDALLRWLDTSSQTWTPELTKMVQPYNDPSAPLICYAVPKEIGKVGKESPTFIEPIATREDGIKAMFSKQTPSAQYQASSRKRELEKSPSLPIEHEGDDNPMIVGSSRSHENKRPKLSDPDEEDTKNFFTENPNKTSQRAKEVKNLSPKKLKADNPVIKKEEGLDKVISLLGHRKRHSHTFGYHHRFSRLSLLRSMHFFRKVDYTRHTRDIHILLFGINSLSAMVPKNRNATIVTGSANVVIKVP